MPFLDDYEPVENRIRAFWEDHPKGRIVTMMIDHGDNDYIFKALIYRELDLVDEPGATGYAHDSTSTLPNNMKASALEVCETSAIGRALANLGYAPKGKRPSREEMTKASRDKNTGAGGGEGQQDAKVATPKRPTDPIPPTTSVAATGKGSADGSKGEGVSTGGSKRAPSPEDSPWAGMDVE